MDDKHEYRYITEKEIGKQDVKHSFLLKVDRLIATVGRIFNIHSLTTGTHAKNSYHYKGRAVDADFGSYKAHRLPTEDDTNKMINELKSIINNPQKSTLDIIILSRLYGLKGIGVYNWGFHLDDRVNDLLWAGVPIEKVQKELEKAIKNKDTQIYFYLTGRE